jgi:hypothetical protein
MANQEARRGNRERQDNLVVTGKKKGSGKDRKPKRIIPDSPGVPVDPKPVDF